MIVAVHIANGLGDMVAVVADGQLGRMAAATLVDSLELACSFRGLWRGRRGQHVPKAQLGRGRTEVWVWRKVAGGEEARAAVKLLGVLGIWGSSGEDTSPGLVWRGRQKAGARDDICLYIMPM